MKSHISHNDKSAQQLFHMLDHFEHVLPAQASIRDFVHHNTLHGFEHLKFNEALKASNKLTGAYGYWPQEKFREQYQKGRFTNADLDAALLADKSLLANEQILDIEDQQVTRKAVYRIALLYPLKAITPCQLKWKVEEAHVLETFQADLPESTRHAFLKAANSDEKQSINELWTACVDVLKLDDSMLHPEQMVDLSSEQAEKMLDSLLNSETSEELSDEQKEELNKQQQAWKELDLLASRSELQNDSTLNLRNLIKTLTGVDVDESVTAHTQSKVDPLIRNDSWHSQNELFKQVGDNITLRGLLKQLTNVDIQTEIIPSLQRYIANWLDEGFAAWHGSDAKKIKSEHLGFYQSWKQSANVDESWVFKDLPEWQGYIDSLPDNSLDAVIAELTRMDIPQEKWAGYIERSALELPGWSGMFYWRHNRPDYAAPSVDFQNNHADMMDYLAVRLALEHLFARKLCRELWLNEGSLSSLRGYFHRHHDEFSVRYHLYNIKMPEYLVAHSQQLVKQHATHIYRQHEWQLLAQMIWTWQQCSNRPEFINKPSDQTADPDLQTKQQNRQQTRCKRTKPNDAWILFRLAQHLALPANVVRALSSDQINLLFDCIAQVSDPEKSGFLLLKAYEHNYREKVFSVVAKNHGRGTWADRQQGRPAAQIFFCMDDREEGIRRHLEQINPQIETLGAAAFYGVVMQWKGLDDAKTANLCPVVEDPVHEVDELVAEEHIDQLERHTKRYKRRITINDTVHQETRRDVLISSLLMVVSAPAALATLIGKIFIPRQWGAMITAVKNHFDVKPTTRITSTCSEPKAEPTMEQPQQGFSIDEQTEIVESFLQNNGLLSGFSQFVIILGHYSNNQNNPHTAAYGCGACGGKFSGPNGRVFSAMANHPDVRAELANRGIHIPDDCWFVGGEHDTCNEAVVFDDTDLIPENLQAAFTQLKKDLTLASKHSAHERCRKLASAPRKPDLKVAAKHIKERGVDFSQARPELGHATIAVGFVGRRHLSQSTFMDRRCFLISYDPNVDPEGEFLERTLLIVGPVGAGINLEYYFSSVNNEKFGCGSKIVHNLAGLFGVMEGCTGDLRTGLPLQMIEIHEPMRLQLMVEAKTEILTKIYQRQETIQRLVGNGWLLLSAKDPDSPEIQTFDPEKGWEVWKDSDNNGGETSIFKQSVDWYGGNYDHLPPVLLEQPDVYKNNSIKNNKEVNHA